MRDLNSLKEYLSGNNILSLFMYPKQNETSYIVRLTFQSEGIEINSDELAMHLFKESISKNLVSYSEEKLSKVRIYSTQLLMDEVSAFKDFKVEEPLMSVK